MSRRRGSATALKASDVVAARGMFPIYTDMGICQEALSDRRFQSRPDRGSRGRTSSRRFCRSFYLPGVKEKVHRDDQRNDQEPVKRRIDRPLSHQERPIAFTWLKNSTLLRAYT